MAKGRIKINLNRCKGCLLCIDECKFSEIAISKTINNVGYNIVDFLNKGHCNACKMCAIICPDAAIEVIKIIEEKDEPVD